MAILTVQIPDTELLTLASIVEQLKGNVLKAATEAELEAGECTTHREELFIKNKIKGGDSHVIHLWND